MAIGIAIFLWFWLRSHRIPRLLGLIPLSLAALYLTPVDHFQPYVRHFYVETGALSPAPWALTQFILVMPAGLYGAFRLLCPDADISRIKFQSVGQVLLISFFLLGCSLAYLIIHPVEQLRGWSSLLAYAVFLALSILSAASFFRWGITLYVHVRDRPQKLFAVIFFVALLAPLGDLWLNSVFRFPTSLQLHSIYALTAINGIILLLPNFASPIWQNVIWLARCILLPYTLYFFALFLPSLFLVPFAVIFLGAGLLLYVPTLLLILHVGRLIDGYRSLINPRRSLLYTGIILAFAAPLTYTAQALLDRFTLRGALEDIRRSDLDFQTHASGQTRSLDALNHLYDFRRGHYVPLVTEYYRSLVFTNLAMTRRELNVLLALSGTPLPDPTQMSSDEWYYWGKEGAAMCVADREEDKHPLPILPDTSNPAAIQRP